MCLNTDIVHLSMPYVRVNCNKWYSCKLAVLGNRLNNLHWLKVIYGRDSKTLKSALNIKS